jgi:hypothetical protein
MEVATIKQVKSWSTTRRQCRESFVLPAASGAGGSAFSDLFERYWALIEIEESSGNPGYNALRSKRKYLSHVSPTRTF